MYVIAIYSQKNCCKQLLCWSVRSLRVRGHLLHWHLCLILFCRIVYLKQQYSCYLLSSFGSLTCLSPPPSPRISGLPNWLSFSQVYQLVSGLVRITYCVSEFGLCGIKYVDGVTFMHVFSLWPCQSFKSSEACIVISAQSLCSAATCVCTCTKDSVSP